MYDRQAMIDADWDTRPFNHAVIDGMWDEEFLRSCRSEFPAANDGRWITYNDPEERGKKAGPASMWGPSTSHFFEMVRSADFNQGLEKLTGIKNLTSDDIGGGMHETGEGGRLELHIDFNFHPSLPLERRLNMLVFLNDEWKREWGGVIHLGRRDDSNRVEMLPTFNRTLIFECSESSFHGHPESIVGDHLRRSLACYYYSPIREEAAQAHSTVWDHAR